MTWEYLGMLLGRPGVKPDQWVIQAVSNAVDRPVPAREAQDIVLAAAKDMKQHATRPEHALWAYERKRPKDRSR